jgi:hypothetical protein
LIAEDAGFRQLFKLLGIRPIFITAEELFANPQNALWAPGGVPEQNQSESPLAAFCNLDRDAQADLARRYEGPCRVNVRQPGYAQKIALRA